MKKNFFIVLIFILCSVGFSAPKNLINLILVTKGNFMMGDTFGDGSASEKPVHKVTITHDFYIGKYEITFDEYDLFCKETSRKKPDDSGFGRGKKPVINISWSDAIQYCNWLSEKEGLKKAYDDEGNLLDSSGFLTGNLTLVEGYRLPSEAEWEYAARGGMKSKGFKYSGSSNENDVAWYDKNSLNKTIKTGSKKGNELDIRDMSGNVWEWCNDWWDENFYKKSRIDNPLNYKTSTMKVIRGGSWYNLSWQLRNSFRSSEIPSKNSYNIGFRICRTIKH